MAKRVAMFISGSGSNMVSLVTAMQNDPEFGAVPTLVLSNNTNAGGLTKATNMGIATAVVDHRPFGKDRRAFEDVVHETLLDHTVDIICLAGFMRVLTPWFMDQWAGKMLNIHPSLLPKYKGLHTHQRALDAGDTIAGCTVHKATAALDDGPILEQAQVDILPNDTAETLAARVLLQEHVIYPKALRRFVAHG